MKIILNKCDRCGVEKKEEYNEYKNVLFLKKVIIQPNCPNINIQLDWEKLVKPFELCSECVDELLIFITRK